MVVIAISDRLIASGIFYKEPEFLRSRNLQPLNVKMLFVTALFLPENGVAHKGLEEYLEHGRHLVAAGVPLRVHTSPDLAERLRNSWKGISSDHVEICTDALVEPYWNLSLRLPSQRNESKDTAFFLSVQLSKLKFCAMAAKSSDFVAWVDYGVFHVIKDVEAVQENLRSVAHRLPASGRTRLLSPTAWAEGCYELWHTPCWRHLGGFLLGPSSAFVSAYDKQLKLVIAGLPTLTWEINYWAMMDDEFDGYSANHNDSLIANALTVLLPCADGSQTPANVVHRELDEPTLPIPSGQEEVDGGLPNVSSEAVLDAAVV